MGEDKIKEKYCTTFQTFRLSKHERHQLAPNPQALFSIPLQLSTVPLQLLSPSIEVEDYAKKSFGSIRRKSQIKAGSEECKNLAHSSQKGYLN